MTNHDFKARHDDHGDGGDFDDDIGNESCNCLMISEMGKPPQNDVNPNFLNNND